MESDIFETLAKALTDQQKILNDLKNDEDDTLLIRQIIWRTLAYKAGTISWEIRNNRVVVWSTLNDSSDFHSLSIAKYFEDIYHVYASYNKTTDKVELHIFK